MNYVIKYKKRPLRLYVDDVDEYLGDGRKRKRRIYKVLLKKNIKNKRGDVIQKKKFFNIDPYDYSNMGKIIGVKVNKNLAKDNAQIFNPNIKNMRDLQYSNMLNSNNTTNTVYQIQKELQQQIQPIKEEIKKIEETQKEDIKKREYNKDETKEHQKKVKKEIIKELSLRLIDLNKELVLLEPKILSKKEQDYKKKIEKEIENTNIAIEKLQNKNVVVPLEETKIEPQQQITEKIEQKPQTNEKIEQQPQKNENIAEPQPELKSNITKEAKKNQQKKGKGKNESDDKSKNEGLTHEDIYNIMSPYSKKCNFVGVFALDEAIKFLDNTKNNNFCMIINLLTIKELEKYVGHFVVLNIDYNEGYIEYFDPFGKNLPNKLKDTIVNYAKRIFDDIKATFKINKNKQQSYTSANCGWFCIDFIFGRRLEHKTFKHMTEHDLIQNNEKYIEKFKKKFNHI